MASLLTRDGGVQVGYVDMDRIKRGDVLTMPQGRKEDGGGGLAVDVRNTETPTMGRGRKGKGMRLLGSGRKKTPLRNLANEKKQQRGEGGGGGRGGGEEEEDVKTMGRSVSWGKGVGS